MRAVKPQWARRGDERFMTGNWLYLTKELGYCTAPDIGVHGEYVECQTCGAWYDPNEEA